MRQMKNLQNLQSEGYVTAAQVSISYWKKNKDIKEVIRSHKAKKGRQFNDDKIMNKALNNGRQNITQRTKD